MVRPLSMELQKIAIEELHENPKSVEADIKHMQEWIKEQRHLNAPIDAQWILGFLRGCKFDLEGAKKKFDWHYTLKTLIPEMMQARDIYSTEMHAILKAGIILPLPYFEGYKVPRVILVRFNNVDESTTSLEKVIVLFYMILMISMIEDDNFIISGVRLWTDCSCLSFGFMQQFTLRIMKNFYECLRNGFPFRIKGLHYWGSSELTEKLLMLIKPYLGSKLKHRLYSYSEDNLEHIFKTIPKKHVPKEYGGENSNIEEITAYWINKVESYSTWFSKNNQFSSIEALRPGEPATLDDVIGNDGSFEKLNID